MAAAARIVRAGEALLVEATAQVCDRSDGRLTADRMTTRFGCRSTSELVQRVTRVSKQRAGDLVKAARAVVRPVALTSGEVLPAQLPAMREALAAVEVGVDGVVAVAGPLLSCGAGYGGDPGGRRGDRRDRAGRGGGCRTAGVRGGASRARDGVGDVPRSGRRRTARSAGAAQAGHHGRGLP